MERRSWGRGYEDKQRSNVKGMFQVWDTETRAVIKALQGDMGQEHKCEDLGARGCPLLFFSWSTIGRWWTLGKPLPSSSQIGSIDVKQEGSSHQDQTVGAGEKIPTMLPELQFSPKPRDTLRKKNQCFFSPQWQGGPSSSLRSLCGRSSCTHLRLIQLVRTAA